MKKLPSASIKSARKSESKTEFKPKVLAVVGPTASGKTALSITLACLFNGEIISADSRQVYKGLNIGSGKVTKQEMRNVPHHLIDVVSPNKVYSVAQYQKEASNKLKDILQRGKLPIVVGGTGFYIQALLENLEIPPVKPNKKLRATLEKKSLAELHLILKRLDPRRARTIDRQNPRRLIRAIEIASTLGTVPKISSQTNYEILKLGINPGKEKLALLIRTRLVKRLRSGMIQEVRKLHEQGVSWKRLEELGLEYRFLAQYLQKKLSKKQMIEILEREIFRYAKRQLTWFKRDQSIHWISSLPEAKSLATKFLK